MEDETIHSRSNRCFSGLAKAGSQIEGTGRGLERYTAEFGDLGGDVTGEGGPSGGRGGGGPGGGSGSPGPGQGAPTAAGH